MFSLLHPALDVVCLIIALKQTLLAWLFNSDIESLQLRNLSKITLSNNCIQTLLKAEPTL